MLLYTESIDSKRNSGHSKRRKTNLQQGIVVYHQPSSSRRTTFAIMTLLQWFAFHNSFKVTDMAKRGI
jgi:hypothetical protein